MAGDRKSRNTTNLFLVSLSMADLLMLLLCVPLKTVYFFVVLWDSGGAACKVANYIMMLSFTASVLNLTAVSIERFIVIVFPMRSRSLCTMSNCRRSVMVVWVMSLLLASPVIFVMRMSTVVYMDPAKTVRVTAYYCQKMDSLAFVTYQLSVLFVVPALLMIVFYTAVIRELWRSTKTIIVLTNSTARGTETYYLQTRGRELTAGRLTAGRNGRNNMAGDSAYNSSASLYVPQPFLRSRTPSPGGRCLQRKREKGEDVRKARKQVIKMLIVVVVLFLLCWGPSIIMGVFYNFNIIFVLLPFIHCCINPVIYCSMSKNFRRAVKQYLSCRRTNTSTASSCCVSLRCCSKDAPPPGPLRRVMDRSVFSSYYSPEVTTRHTDVENVSNM
uniref:G-protein coupled receptors family 1 profile domain-containing protein n=1 Tax=Scylla olivacea TaxID=85551 RepID=A0A0P4VXT6_SCYOL